MFIETIIGSRAKVKILRVLSEVRTAYSLKNLKEETALSLGITHKAAEELAGEKILVKIRGVRKERLYKFNSDHALAAPIFELFRQEKTRQRQDVVLLQTWNLLEQFVASMKKSHMVLLFGSQARGDATLRSDIDVLVVQDDITMNLDSKIVPTVVSLSTFNDEVDKNTLFYRNLKKDAIILYLNPKAKEQLSVFLEDMHYYGQTL